MAQQLRVFAALSEHLSSIPSTHIKWFTAAFKASSRGSALWPLQLPAHV